MRHQNTRRGFTLIELLVVVAIIALLVSILLPSLGRAKDLTKRAACGANLKAIGTAMELYRSGARGMFPALYKSYDYSAMADAPFKTTNVAPFAWTTPQDHTQAASNNREYGEAIQQTFVPMIYGGLAQEKAFVCPATKDQVTDRAQNKQYGFASVDNVSYGIQWVTRWHISTTNGEVDLTRSNGAGWLSKQLEQGAVLVADRCDSGKQKENSPNHGGAGQNVMRTGGTVDFAGSVATGWSDNWIYTRDVNPYTHATDPGGLAADGGANWGAKPQHWGESLIMHSQWKP